MGTKLKTGTVRHLALVPPFTPYEVTPTEPWWVCPPWCAGDCYGGETYVFAPDLPGTVTSRLHEKVVYTTTAVEEIDGGEVEVLVRIERCDSDEDSTAWPSDVVLKITGVGVRLTRAQRRELAAALLNADDLDDTPEQAPMAVSA